jgi:1-acyl-sn-glycerol-3-phosphate acyltransferase
MTGRVSFAIWIRSWIYLALFLAWTIGASLVLLPTLLRREWTLVSIRFWVRGIMILARGIIGITCRITGKENVPSGACIIAAQHQASFETYRIFLDLPHPVFVLKRELTWIPLLGWYMGRAGLVPIDRAAGATAMRKMLRAAEAALARGDQIVVFPEGTRVPPGQQRPYQPGIFALYAHLGVPVVPMALNTGVLWGKTRILKIPGEIVFRFLPPLPVGLGKDDMLNTLRAEIEGADLTV